MTLRVDLIGAGAGMTPEQIEQYLKDSTGGYTHEQLDEAFRQVQDADHWKNPIDAVVDRSMWDVLAVAIPYFTGTDADHDDVDGQPDRIRVFAPGYFAGPCN